MQTTIAEEMQTLGLRSPNEYFHYLYNHRAGMPPPPAPPQAHPLPPELLARLDAIEQRFAATAPAAKAAPALLDAIGGLRADVAARHMADTRIHRGQFAALVVVGFLSIGAIFASLAAGRSQPPAAPTAPAPTEAVTSK